MGVGALGVLSSGTLPFATLSSKKEELSKRALAHRPGRAHSLPPDSYLVQARGHMVESGHLATDLRVDDLWADPLAMATIDGQASAGSDHSCLVCRCHHPVCDLDFSDPIPTPMADDRVGYGRSGAHLALPQHPAPGVAHGREQFISGGISSFEPQPSHSEL